MTLDQYIKIFNRYEELARGHFSEFWEDQLRKLPERLTSHISAPHDVHWYYTNMGYIAKSAGELFEFGVSDGTALSVSDFWFGWRFFDSIVGLGMTAKDEKLVDDYVNALFGNAIQERYEPHVESALATITEVGRTHGYKDLETSIRGLQDTRRDHKKSASFEGYHAAAIDGGLLSGEIIYQMILFFEGVPPNERLRQFLRSYATAGNLMDNIRDRKDDQKELGLSMTSMDLARAYVDLVRYTIKTFTNAPEQKVVELLQSIRVSFINARMQYGFSYLTGII